MRVLFVSSGNSSSGISPIILNQGVSLEKEGIHILYFTIKGKGIKGYIKNARPLKELIKKEQIDLIHAHYGLTGLLVYIAQLFSIKKKCLIVSYMGDDLLGSTNTKGRYTFVSKLIVLLNKCLASYYNSWNIVKSQKMALIMSKSKRLTVIPNGVDFSKFFPCDKKIVRKKIGLDQNKKIILFAADPSRPEKNFKLTQQAVKKLKSANVELITVFNKEQDVLLDYYNAADVIVMSSFHEGSPNVIKEAMACNRPIVVTDVGDVRQVISDTEGCFISDYDVNDFSEKITRALNFNSQTNGREKIRHLESSFIARKIIDVYRNVIK